MGALDLNKVAICMGKVIKLLSQTESLIITGQDVYDHKEKFMTIAYMCRVGILDRIANNPYMSCNPNLPIRIPTGIFSSRKETISSGMSITIGKLKEIVQPDVVTSNYVDEILNKGRIFYQFEESLPAHIRQSL